MGRSGAHDQPGASLSSCSCSLARSPSPPSLFLWLREDRTRQVAHGDPAGTQDDWSLWRGGHVDLGLSVNHRPACTALGLQCGKPPRVLRREPGDSQHFEEMKRPKRD
ncbi:hypothetical protein GN956_G12358 [Arapaima gigas]